mgnify:FL=1
MINMGNDFIGAHDPSSGFLMSMQDAGTRAAQINSGTVTQDLNVGVDFTQDVSPL